MRAIKFTHAIFVGMLIFIGIVTGCKNNPASSSDELIWQQTNQPLGANVNALIANDDGVLFAGTNTAVFFSENKGQSWRSAELRDLDIAALTITTSNRVFASTNAGLFFADFPELSWQQITALAIQRTAGLVMLPDDEMLVGTDGGVFHSSDHGETWSLVGLEDALVEVFMLAEDNIYAGGEGGIFVSKVGDFNWRNLLSIRGTIFSLAINSSGDLFAGSMINDTGNAGLLFRSADAGTSWTETRQGSDLPVSQIRTLLAGVNDHLLAGAWGFSGNEVSGLYVSSDNGRTWAQTSLLNKAINTLVTAADGRIYAGTSAGIFRSDDQGVRWQPTNQGLDTQWEFIKVNVIFSHTTEGIHLGTDFFGVLATNDFGKSWVQRGLSTLDVFSLAQKNRSIWAGTLREIYHSGDNGTTWQLSGHVPSHTYRSILIHPMGDIIAGTELGVVRSSDDGRNWQWISDLTSNGSILDDRVNSLAVNSDGDVFAATEERGVWVSRDTGSSWTAVSPGLPDSPLHVIEVDDRDALWTGGRGGLYRSTDSRDWQVTALNIPVNSIALLTSAQIFAGTTNGVFFSSDSGRAWNEMSSELGNREVSKVALDKANYLYAATKKAGVFRTQSPVIR